MALVTEGTTISSDNYYLIRRRDDHTFVPLMGFASDELRPTVRDPGHAHYGGYATPEEALNAVINEWAEYGHSIDPECYLANDEFDAIVRRRKELAEELDYIIRQGRDDHDPRETTAAHLAAFAEEWFLAHATIGSDTAHS